MITAEERRVKYRELQATKYPRLIERIENTIDHWSNLGQLYCEFELTLISDYSEAVINELKLHGYHVELRKYMDSQINAKRTILKISWSE